MKLTRTLLLCELFVWSIFIKWAADVTPPQIDELCGSQTAFSVDANELPSCDVAGGGLWPLRRAGHQIATCFVKSVLNFFRCVSLIDTFSGICLAESRTREVHERRDC